MHSRLKYLVNQYLQNQLSGQENDELQAMINDPANNSELLDLMEEKWNREDFVPGMMSDEDSASILQNVIAAEQSQSEVHGKIIRIVPWWLKSVAIVLILSCVTGAYLYLTAQEDSTGVTIAKNLSSLADSSKRGDLATLTLSDGSIILINKSKAGMVARDGQTTVSNSGPMLAYNAGSESDNDRLNTLTTRKGQEYAVVLPDGSKVWLNGSSSITFPVAFASDKRQVSITGEALFKVSKDAGRPFRVVTSGPTVEVLGTFFNVNAYPTERQVKTTLIEGSVALHNGAKTVRILPGQQAMLNADGNFDVINLEDAEDVIAWNGGNMSFANDSLVTVIRHLERWYDVQILDKTDGTVQGFSGTIPKNLSLDDLAEFLSNRVSANVNGRVLVLTNRQ